MLSKFLFLKQVFKSEFLWAAKREGQSFFLSLVSVFFLTRILLIFRQRGREREKH